MEDSRGFIMAVGSFGITLFFYVLYLVGGVARNVKTLLVKIEEIERRLTRT